MSRLSDLTADRVLEQLEVRGDAYAQAKHQAALSEWAYDRAKAAAFTAYKSAGNAVETAKAMSLENETVIACFESYLSAELAKDKAQLSLERARTASELWRSEQANLRRV